MCTYTVFFKGFAVCTIAIIYTVSVEDLQKWTNTNTLGTFMIKSFLVFIRIRWIGTGSHPYEKSMSSIVLYPVFYEYRNVQS